LIKKAGSSAGNRAGWLALNLSESEDMPPLKTRTAAPLTVRTPRGPEGCPDQPSSSHGGCGFCLRLGRNE
jgi:hypothetical protein